MKHWNPVPWLREMQAACDPKKDLRYGMAADEIERLRLALAERQRQDDETERAATDRRR
jgi:hypothetical protein